MLLAAFWLLLAAAIGGIGIATLDIGTRPVRLVHGTLGGIGLLILLIGALGVGSGLVWAAFGLLLLGFVAGVTFFGVIWRESAPPRNLIVGHGALNGVGLLLLAIAVFA